MTKRTPSPSTIQAGFTLVELAIVLMIIGLLIAGILRGQELMNNARINETIRQVKAYDATAVTFLQAYGGWAGDFAMAATRLPGCNAANFCTAGNGDGKVGNTTASTLTSMQLGTGAPARETTNFFKHLALAGLISSVEAGANPATAEWGRTHPKAALRGGYNILFLGVASGSVQTSGHYLRLQMPIRGSSAFTGGATNDPTEAVSPKEAWQIDVKMDDGRPDMGSVLSDDRAGGASACEGNRYDASKTTNQCIMYFKMH